MTNIFRVIGLSAGVFAAAAFANAASAATFHCKCDANFATNINPKLQTADFHTECKATWPANQPPNEANTGDYSSLVSATFPEGTPPDSVTSIRIRPRKDGQCTVALIDGHNQKVEWTGANCNQGQNTSRDGFDIVDLPVPQQGLKQMSGQAQLTTMNNKFLAFYVDKAQKNMGTGYILQAMCVEPK